MKVYKYHLKPEVMNDNEIEFRSAFRRQEDALTTDKKVAKKFEKTRNMDSYTKEVVDMDDEEAMFYCNRNQTRKLIMKSLTTVYRPYESDGGTVEEIMVPVTEEEYTAVTTFTENDSSWRYIVYVPPAIMSKDIRKALKAVSYTAFHKFYITMEDCDEMPDFIIDEIALLINLYPERFNK